MLRIVTIDKKTQNLMDLTDLLLRTKLSNGPAGPAFLTEMSQSCRGVRIRLDFCRIVRIGVVMGWPSQSRPGLAPRFAGLWVVRASSPAPRANGA